MPERPISSQCQSSWVLREHFAVAGHLSVVKRARLPGRRKPQSLPIASWVSVEYAVSVKFAFFIFALAFSLAACSDRNSSGSPPAQAYKVKGVVREVKPNDKMLIIRHEKVPGYMEAMTMPFNIRDPSILTNVTVGDEINFVLHVTSDESWIDQVVKTGTRVPIARG